MNFQSDQERRQYQLEQRRAYQREYQREYRRRRREQMTEAEREEERRRNNEVKRLNYARRRAELPLQELELENRDRITRQ